MITKEIKIGDKNVLLGASAALPMEYKECTGREWFADLNKVNKQNITVVNEMVYYMARHAFIHSDHQPGETFPKLNDWLLQFGMMDVFNCIEDAVDLWLENVQHSSVSKKKTSTKQIENLTQPFSC